MTNMTIKLVFLGLAKDFAGTECASLELPQAATLADLRTLLSEQFVGLRGRLEVIRLAVNESFAADDTVLNDGDEVALIPPVSGGAGGIHVDLVTEPISVEAVRHAVMGDPELGAIVTFEGATRREPHAEHGSLERLDYVAYEGMARRQLERLAGEAMERWHAGRVAIVHRLGSVPPGEVSVMIAVACGHRAEAFDACRWLIDTLKQDVPIWKKDVFEDGYVRWTEPP